MGANRGQPARSCMHTRGADRHAAQRGGTKRAKKKKKKKTPPPSPSFYLPPLPSLVSISPVPLSSGKKKAKLSTTVLHDTVTPEREQTRRDRGVHSQRKEGNGIKGSTDKFAEDYLYTYMLDLLRRLSIIVVMCFV